MRITLPSFPTRRSSDLDHRDGAVLHLSGGVAFGVDIGNFLELERAFECNGKVVLAAKEKEIFCLRVFERDSFDRVVLDRKSTRLNSSHQIISYAVFCLK